MPTVKKINGQDIIHYNINEVSYFLVMINDASIKKSLDETEEKFIAEMNLLVLRLRMMPSKKQIDWIEKIYTKVT